MSASFQNVCVNARVKVGVCVCAGVCVCVRVYVCEFECVCVCVCEFEHACMCVCVNIFTVRSRTADFCSSSSEMCEHEALWSSGLARWKQACLKLSRSEFFLTFPSSRRKS